MPVVPPPDESPDWDGHWTPWAGIYPPVNMNLEVEVFEDEPIGVLLGPNGKTISVVFADKPSFGFARFRD